LVPPPGKQDGEHPVAPGHGLPDDLSVICVSRDDCDLRFEFVEFRDALLPADANDFISALQRMLHHVSAKFAGCSDDTDFHILLLS
jgi:hypothetical protein